MRKLLIDIGLMSGRDERDCEYKEGDREMNARSVGRKAVSGWSKTGEWSSDSSSLD